MTDVVLVSAIMTDDIPRKFLSDHMFLTSSFMVYRKIKKLRQIWHDKIRQGRQNYNESAYVKICSNHFEDGERTFRCSVPTLVLTKSNVKTQQSPQTLSDINNTRS